MRALLLILLLALASSDVAAQQQRQMCAPRKPLLEKFLQEFGEAPVAGGLDAQGNLIEILASPSESWTAIVSSPSGQTCVVGSGQSWRTYAPTVPGRDS